MVSGDAGDAPLKGSLKDNNKEILPSSSVSLILGEEDMESENSDFESH